MSIKNSLRNLARRGIRLSATAAENELRDYRNVDIVLSAAVREPHPPFHDPVAYVDFLRGCIQPARHSVTEIKANTDSADIAAKRFNILVEELREGLPTVAFSVARELALIADKNRADLESKMPPGRVADLGLFFSKSSSFGRKGRILFNLVRFMRSENCLELGTAVGMSALFILAALTAYAKSGRLVTVESNESHFLTSSSLLKQRYGEAVACHFGETGSILPAIVKSLGTIDFMFHDCGHSRDQYIHDFNHVSEILAPGAVVLFDDIRWEHAWFPSKGGAHTYEGWQAVVGHHRVRRAVEIDDDLGLLLIGT
jgi:predicted O-methyltransferase YrrM